MINTEEDVLYIDKPLDWSSFDVVKKIRSVFGVKKVGHAGTLDPKATGLLITCIGRACKRISYFQEMPKTYIGTFCLGEERPSYDIETSVIRTHTLHQLTIQQLHDTAQLFVGTISQTPPLYSAIKVNGIRAYQLARNHTLSVTLPKRTIRIYTFQLLDIELPWVHFSLQCSKGTYVRSLVHDFGQKVGVGAALHKLRRTAIGEISIAEAIDVTELCQ